MKIRSATRGAPPLDTAGAALVARCRLLATALLLGAAIPAGAHALAAGAPADSSTLVAIGPLDRVTGGAASLDELIARFLAALRAQDTAALESLRLTRDEYVQLVMPGHVPPGAPAQRLGAEAADYFFSVMNTKSRHHRSALVQRFGGRRLELDDLSFEKGVTQYAGHRSHRRATLRLREADGRLVELRTGSVVERDGRFKFASYIRD